MVVHWTCSATEIASVSTLVVSWRDRCGMGSHRTDSRRPARLDLERIDAAVHLQVLSVHCLMVWDVRWVESFRTLRLLSEGDEEMA